MVINLCVGLIKMDLLMGSVLLLCLEAVMEDTILILSVMKINLNSKSSKEGFCRIQCSMVLARNYSKMGTFILESSRVEFSKAMEC